MSERAFVRLALVCQKCGAPLPEGEWGGSCPRCLIAAFAEEENESIETDPAATELVPGFVVQEEIARGGMGIVYRAVQRHPSRVVALKMILPQLLGSARIQARFRAEVEAVAKLDHPNVLPIYEAGENRGVPYLAMKFVPGGSLAQRRAEFLGKPVACARLVAAAARGVQHAHERGILHRDLKPANLLLDGPSHESVSSQIPTPLVGDFGLARWLDTASDLTHTLTVFGTPGFIAPEQAKGSAANLTPAADVYSLGAVLFDLLTGRPPFLGEHALAVIQQASEKPAPKLRTLSSDCGIDRDLETICAKCLEREPGARYRSAADLAEDLDRWLDGRPIMARPVSAPVRVLRWSRRNPATALSGVSLVGLAAAVAMMIWKSEPIRPLPTKGIAVLPFENLSEDKEHAFFADGVQDDILTKLAKIADLKVISRTSVMQYRSERNIREIGNALRVSHVLEGSVRKTGRRLHINAQLIDTRSDMHVWAEEYDRYVNDMFAIQSEIARKVAARLGAKISAAEKLALARRPTADVAAFDLYSHAKNLLLTVSSSIKAKPNMLEAVDLLNDAVTRDPAFFQAYCQLARIHEEFYFLGHDHTPARLALAEAAVQAAFRLRPDAGEAHLARAEYLYRGHLDYDSALAELETARQTLPNESRIFELEAYIERRRPGGSQEKAVHHFERAIELDPRNFFILQQAAMSYDLLRRYADEAAVLDRALTIIPNDAETKVWRAGLEMDWKADTGPLHQVIDELRAKDPAAIQSVADMWIGCALAERDPAAAANALAALGENSFGDETIRFSPRFVEGLIARMTKDDRKARSAFAAARVEQEKIVQAQPNYAPPLCVLGLIDAGLGRKEEALREGRRAVELLPVEKDALNGTRMIEHLAQIAAWVGEKDLACEQLAAALRSPNSFLNYGKLKLSPFWDPLRGEPCFEKIVASLTPKEN
jgi:TolB-like protein/Tfp pilus assembly protein PilF